MLPNPFTPSRIANKPQDFFGRENELAEVPRAIRQGSLVIDGPIGIGKSSLLSQMLLLLEGSRHKQSPIATVYPIVCDASLKSPEDIAARILSELADQRERMTKTKFMLPKILEVEKSIVTKPTDGAGALRGVCALLAATGREHERLVVIALDEADKCAAAVAQFIRVVLTRTELDQSGLDRVRFVVAGISPFYSSMIDTDAGVARFIYQRYSLPPFKIDEAIDFLEQKFDAVLESPEGIERNLECSDSLYEHIARVTGGHPHLLQLVGSYVIDHEDGDPDNKLNARDLVGCFNRICYQSRGPVYERMLHSMMLEGHLDGFRDLLDVAEAKCPTSITAHRAAEVVDDECLKYLVTTGILSFDGAGSYRLNDEFLRIRMLMDDPDVDRGELEHHLLVDWGYIEEKLQRTDEDIDD